MKKINVHSQFRRTTNPKGTFLLPSFPNVLENCARPLVYPLTDNIPEHHQHYELSTPGLNVPVKLLILKNAHVPETYPDSASGSRKKSNLALTSSLPPDNKLAMKIGR